MVKGIVGSGQLDKMDKSGSELNEKGRSKQKLDTGGNAKIQGELDMGSPITINTNKSGMESPGELADRTKSVEKFDYDKIGVSETFDRLDGSNIRSNIQKCSYHDHVIEYLCETCQD